MVTIGNSEPVFAHISFVGASGGLGAGKASEGDCGVVCTTLGGLGAATNSGTGAAGITGSGAVGIDGGRGGSIKNDASGLTNFRVGSSVCVTSVIES